MKDQTLKNQTMKNPTSKDQSFKDQASEGQASEDQASEDLTLKHQVSIKKSHFKKEEEGSEKKNEASCFSITNCF